MKTTIEKLDSVLKETQLYYSSAAEGLEMFQKIHKLLWKDGITRNNKIKQLDDVFERIWGRSQEIYPNYTRAERKSFLHCKETSYWKIIAEWTRLLDRYKLGLFKCYDFPVVIKSNVEMEQKFSTENRRFRSQSGRAHVGQMIETRGEYVLRLQYCSPSDIDFEKIISNSEDYLADLRAQLQVQISTCSKRWKFSEGEVNYYIQVLQKIYGINMKKTTGKLQLIILKIYDFFQI